MKLLIFGSGPWPLEPGAVVTGPSIRLRQFVDPLRDSDHEVSLALLEGRPRDVRIAGVTRAAAFGPETIADPAVISATGLAADGVDAVFGVGSLLPVYAAACFAEAHVLPFWADYFGDPIAELDALQSREGTADPLARDHIWKLYRAATMRGDRFSTVSGPQRHGLLGQLALLGRGCLEASLPSIAHVIPCAVPDRWCEPCDPAPLPLGFELPRSFIWFGGTWNVWLDARACGEAVKLALEMDRDVRFLFRGIPTGQPGERVKEELLAPLSNHRDRVFEVPSTVPEEAILARAGAAVCLDRPVLESEFGSRNRLLAMVRWGARPVVSANAEVCRELEAVDLAASVSGNDALEAARELLRGVRRSTAERTSDGRRGLEWLQGVAFSNTMQPVRHWLSAGAPRWPAPAGNGQVSEWAAYLPEAARKGKAPVRSTLRGLFGK